MSHPPSFAPHFLSSPAAHAPTAADTRAADTRETTATPTFAATIVEVSHRCRDITVIRAVSDNPTRPVHAPGQYVPVQAPQVPGRWRNLFMALPPNSDGQLEFHINIADDKTADRGHRTDNTDRPAPARDLARLTRPGDRWLIGPAAGDPVSAANIDTVIVAEGTGWAPMKSLLTDYFGRPAPQSVHLFLGARSPGELYDLRFLWEFAASAPWLHVLPVLGSRTDPWWMRAGAESAVPRGLGIPIVGTVDQVVSGFGPWLYFNVLIAGPQPMVASTVAAMTGAGTPRSSIHTITL